MKLSKLMKQLKVLEAQAKKAGVDPEVRTLILPNFPTALSLETKVVSTLDKSFSKDCRAQGHFIYFAEKADEGAVYGEITERFGWGEIKPFHQRVDAAPEPKPTKALVKTNGKSLPDATDSIDLVASTSDDLLDIEAYGEMLDATK